MKSHSNTFNVFMGFLLKGVQLLFPLLTFPYASRILSVDGIGQVSFAQSLLNFFSMLAMLGIPLYGIRACAKYRDDKTLLTKTAIEIIILNTLSVIFSYVLLFAFCFFNIKTHEYLNLIFIFSFTIPLTFIGMEWLFQAVEDYEYITLRGIIGKVIAAIYLFIFVRNSSDTIHYAICLVLGTVGTNIINLLRVRKLIQISLIKEKLNLKIHIKPILTMFIFSAIASIYTSIDSIMLGYISNDYQVGLYSTATKIKSVLVGIIGTVSSVLLPRTTYLINLGKTKEVSSMMKTTMNFTFFIAIPCCFFCICMSKQIIELLSGVDFLPAVPSLIIITPAILFVSITGVIGVQYYVSTNNEKYLVRANSMGAITDIVLNLFLIPVYGAWGAAFATLIAEILVTFTLITCEKNIIIRFFDLKEIIVIFLSTAIATILIYYIPSFSSTIIELATKGLCFLFIYFLCLLLLKDQITTQAIKVFKKSLS